MKTILILLALCAPLVSQGGIGAARWISGGTASPESPAPVLSRDVVLTSAPTSAVFTVAVAGWGEVSVNGEKIGEDVLAPVTCQPDRRLSSLSCDLSGALRVGRNTVEILLGNGWFNAFTKSSWGFHAAPWLGSPKAKGVLTINGTVALVTDGSWRVHDSPIVFNALRNGEWYDARLEDRRPNDRPATVEKYAPWACVSPEDAAPCREFECLSPVRTLQTPDGATIYDFGANISGWCEIDVRGDAGAKVVLDHDESLTPTNTLLGHVTCYLSGRGEPRPVQHDEYTLAGRAEGERWHPRFTYHGFRYVKVTVSGKAELRSIRARFVHSDFPVAGTVEISDPTFAALQAVTVRSYLSNFVGIPTDCPHREKNGWTGDAQLAMETGLWNFDAKAGYEHFLRMMLDAQRPNGAVPCILPCTPTFGFFWGSGPAWDAVLFEIPWQLHRFYGDDSAARRSYEAMKRYLSFIETKEDGDGLTAYGLGDWCAPDRRKAVEVRLTDSAYVYQFNRRLSYWASRFGDSEYASARNRKAEEIAAAFNRRFYKGDGVYANGEQTALAAALHFDGLCAKGEESKVADRLVRAVRANSHKADFGILGAKWVPRVLARYGHIDDAWKLFTQGEQPGWAHWLQFGDGTLRENWDDSNSHNHIMFGDLSAWAYECLAGINPLEPGFGKVSIRPCCPAGLEGFSISHRTPRGVIRVTCRHENGKPVFTHSVPAGIEVVQDGGDETNARRAQALLAAPGSGVRNDASRRAPVKERGGFAVITPPARRTSSAGRAFRCRASRSRPR